MSTECVLGIDIGTSSTKGVLARPDGTLLGQAQRPHGISWPRPGFAEHDAEAVWWRDVVEICGQLAPLGGNGLRGVCISGIGPCVVPCDRQMQPLRPAILYGIDSRATAEIAELESRYGATAILDRCGSALSSQALGPKLLWLQRNEPEVWRQCAGWYMASSFVAGRLTGVYVLDHHSASQCDPLYDLARGCWAEDWAAEIAPGVPLPELVWSSEPVGSVTAAAASETGLPQGTPVMAGTIDAWAEAFSAGVRRTGDLMLMYGSTMFLICVMDQTTPSPLLWSTEGVAPRQRTRAAGMATSGSLTEWLRDLFGRPPWEDLVIEASAAPPGARGLLVLPHFAGERTPVYDPDARGVLAGLTLSHGRGEILRGAYEGIAFGVRQILDILSQAGNLPMRIVAVGGGTQAPVWLQIVSDVTGVEQAIPRETVGASYGDALLAAIGSGCVPAETDWSSIVRIVEPNVALRDRYDELFKLHSDLYSATSAITHHLAEIQDCEGAQPPQSSAGGLAPE